MVLPHAILELNDSGETNLPRGVLEAALVTEEVTGNTRPQVGFSGLVRGDATVLEKKTF